MSIDFYCGINETVWNKFPVSPGNLSCISPVYGRTLRTKTENRIKIPKYSIVIQDSGAFSDGIDHRLSFEEAFARQIKHSEKYNYADQVESIASYDLLIDEKWEGGIRYKKRWSENEAWEAIKITVESAKFMSKQNISSKILSSQGVTSEQYKKCAIEILDYFNPDDDVFGLGGWCISGKMPSQIRPSFNNTIIKIIPLLASYKVRRVHIWGVIDITFLAPLLWLCDQYCIKLSTDSAGPQWMPLFNMWGYRGWWNKYYTRPQNKPFILGLHRAIHTEFTRDWLKYDVRKSVFYREPKVFLEIDRIF